MRNPCNLIKDLLPLYIDGVCAEETKEMIEAHLAECSECREELRLMRSNLVLQAASPEENMIAKAAASTWKRGKKIAFAAGLLLAVILISLGIALWNRLSQHVTPGMPHVELTIEEDRGRSLLPNGHPVGANYWYLDYAGENYFFHIPTLHGLWQLDEPYAQSTIKMESEDEYLSIFCATGKLRKRPSNILVFRFDLSVVEGEPGTAPDWSEGTEVPLERHGNYYRIYNPERNCVYVARTVWDDGVLEDAWIVLDE